MIIRLPYSFNTPEGKLSFSLGERINSEIDADITNEALVNHLTRTFNNSGDMTNDVEVDGLIVRWTMRYGKLSPRRCSCMLERVEKNTPFVPNT